jgi:hypothetical protein
MPAMIAARFPLALLALCLAACSEEPSELAKAEPTVKPADTNTYVRPPDPPLPKIDLALPARQPVSAGHTRCKDIWGYLRDSDPAGRVVRDAPSSSGRELGRILPPSQSDDWGGGLEATFKVLGSQDGWLEIERAGYDAGLYGKNPPKMYSGRGWIAGGGVWITLQSQLGFSAPSHDSAVLVDFTPNGHFDSTSQQRIVACEGRWVLADWLPGPYKDWPEAPVPAYRKEALVSKRPLVLRAWVTGVCNIQETTCDGVDGNRPETSRLDSES